MTDVAIIGGGAAGLACAAYLCSSGRKLSIIILDSGERAGKKLSQTGNGQGNVSNTDLRCVHYHGSKELVHLAEDIVCSGRYDWRSLFGCLFVTDERGRIYPSGRQASSLTDLLLKRIRSSKDCTCTLRLQTTATKIQKTEEGFRIQTDGGVAESRYAVLCTGGAVARQFRTDGSSYALATDLGHRKTPVLPSLVQLKTDMTDIKTLRGIRVEACLRAERQHKDLASAYGDVIFTSYGVSGSAVFDISSKTAGIIDRGDVVLHLDFLPQFSEHEIADMLRRRWNEGCRDEDLLCGTLHNTVSRMIVRKAKAGGNEASVLQDIVRLVKDFPLRVTGSAGADFAQVTHGGIRGDEVTEELESRIVPGLFMAGEILDLDGDCGGYNLQWAFCSGMHAADAVLKRLRRNSLA
ncbi:MAG: aminoacetone oxidase family FAD-binding enzyme [Clostridia bacterium]|nr:aminoacetone oxidase family FAD-binding enzyme [Clostridia bacterium]